MRIYFPSPADFFHPSGGGGIASQGNVASEGKSDTPPPSDPPPTPCTGLRSVLGTRTSRTELAPGNPGCSRRW
eukprot:30823-Pyramimonas_sp.AAC.1